MSSRKNVEKKEMNGMNLRSRTVAKSVIISDTESEDEPTATISSKFNVPLKIVADSSDEELDRIVKEMTSLNTTYSKGSHEKIELAKNDISLFEIDRMNDL